MNAQQSTQSNQVGMIKKEKMYISIFFALLIGFLGGIFTASVYMKPAPVQGTSVAQQAPQQQQGGLTDQERAQLLDLEMATIKDPSSVAAWTRLGHFHFDTGNPKEAIRAYEKSLELNSKDADVWTDLGVMYRRNHQHDDAIKAFDKAISVDPRHETAMYNKGIVLKHDLNKEAEAIAAWKKLLSINPNAKAPNGTPVASFVN